MPLELLEAENAIAIAQAAGAEQYAADTLGKAKAYLAQGQDYYRRKQSIVPIGAVGRASTQAAEDARLLTLQKKQEEATEAERQRARDRIARAQSEAESESARADEARLDAQRQKEQRELADQERQAAEQARLQAEQAAQQAAQDKAAAEQQLQQSEAQRQAALQQQQALSQQADQARLQAQQADAARLQAIQQAEAQRQRLLTQLNQVLQTRDSARGLIVSMSDVLFDFNRATLKPGAQLRLAKVSGIILAYPDLKLEIDGFTDNKGTEEYNMGLSERRAKAVRDFLVTQGVGQDTVNTRGYGPSNPVASNATASGRQQNRRVELVVSGEAIGSTTTTSTTTTTGYSGGVSGATQGNTVPAQPTTTAPGSIAAPPPQNNPPRP
jgi:outer membrane protein OmpA-like peptidoglycan-associated protein